MIIEHIRGRYGIYLKMVKFCIYCIYSFQKQPYIFKPVSTEWNQIYQSVLLKKWEQRDEAIITASLSLTLLYFLCVKKYGYFT